MIKLESTLGNSKSYKNKEKENRFSLYKNLDCFNGQMSTYTKVALDKLALSGEQYCVSSIGKSYQTMFQLGELNRREFGKLLGIKTEYFGKDIMVDDLKIDLETPLFSQDFRCYSKGVQHKSKQLDLYGSGFLTNISFGEVTRRLVGKNAEFANKEGHAAYDKNEQDYFLVTVDCGYTLYNAVVKNGSKEDLELFTEFGLVKGRHYSDYLTIFLYNSNQFKGKLIPHNLNQTQFYENPPIILADLDYKKNMEDALKIIKGEE